MHEHDGILTLLQIPDVTERLLALKSRQVQPFHLRHALMDSDAAVRRAAVLHPAMTPELLTEVLSGEDKDLRHAALSRPDLSDEQLEMMGVQPEHALEVARHPRCHAELRQRLLDSDIPQGVKDVHQAALDHVQHIDFPGMGVNGEETGPKLEYQWHPQQPHPHDDEKWYQRDYEFLEKGKKDAMKMYKPEDPGFKDAKAHVDWAYKTMPNENWALWSVRDHRQNPDNWSEGAKSIIGRMADIVHTEPQATELHNLRFDKSHSFVDGLTMLADAKTAYQNRALSKMRIAPKPDSATKLLDLGNNWAWWNLGKSMCKDEGRAMGHCGNSAAHVEGDRILSLRHETKVAGTTYWEPHATFIKNGNVLGEMKGRGNKPPEPQYDDDIIRLINAHKLLPFGKEGHAPDNNWSIDRLPDEKKAQIDPLILDAHSRKLSAMRHFRGDSTSRYSHTDQPHIHHALKDPSFIRALPLNEAKDFLTDADFPSSVALLRHTNPEYGKELVQHSIDNTSSEDMADWLTEILDNGLGGPEGVNVAANAYLNAPETMQKPNFRVLRNIAERATDPTSLKKVVERGFVTKEIATRVDEIHGAKELFQDPAYLYKVFRTSGGSRAELAYNAATGQPLVHQNAWGDTYDRAADFPIEMQRRLLDIAMAEDASKTDPNNADDEEGGRPHPGSVLADAIASVPTFFNKLQPADVEPALQRMAPATRVSTAESLAVGSNNPDMAMLTLKYALQNDPDGQTPFLYNAEDLFGAGGTNNIERQQAISSKFIEALPELVKLNQNRLDAVPDNRKPVQRDLASRALSPFLKNIYTSSTEDRKKVIDAAIAMSGSRANSHLFRLAFTHERSEQNTLNENSQTIPNIDMIRHLVTTAERAGVGSEFMENAAQHLLFGGYAFPSKFNPDSKPWDGPTFKDAVDAFFDSVQTPFMLGVEKGYGRSTPFLNYSSGRAATSPDVSAAIVRAVEHGKLMVDTQKEESMGMLNNAIATSPPEIQQQYKDVRLGRFGLKLAVQQTRGPIPDEWANQLFADALQTPAGQLLPKACTSYRYWNPEQAKKIATLSAKTDYGYNTSPQATLAQHATALLEWSKRPETQLALYDQIRDIGRNEYTQGHSDSMYYDSTIDFFTRFKYSSSGLGQETIDRIVLDVMEDLNQFKTASETAPTREEHDSYKAKAHTAVNKFLSFLSDRVTPPVSRQTFSDMYDIVDAILKKTHPEASVERAYERMHRWQEEWNKDALSKSIGYVLYPLLGESAPYTRPMVETKDQSKKRAMYSDTIPQGNSGWLSGSLHDDSDKGLLPINHQMTGSVVARPTSASPETSQKVREAGVSHPIEVHQAAKKIDAGKRLNYIEHHEAQHSIFHRIGQKYGESAQRRVVATTLSRLSEKHRNHIQSLYDIAGVSTGDITADPEESIAYLHNYLMDPNYRRVIHEKMELHDRTSQRQSQDLARKAWNELRRIAASLRPDDVGIDPKSYRNRVDAWLKTLAKRESMPSDQLGFSVSFAELISIARFLTGLNIDLNEVRRGLRAADGDPKKGVLIAYGLNTPEGEKAFDSVRQMRKAEGVDILKAPKSIEGVSPDSERTVEHLREAYKQNRVEPVTLSGKHSGGAYIAKLDHKIYLLKPGSGKKSPAAGVDETKASQSRRETAFSALAKLMGIKEVKPAYLLLVDGKEVACMEMWPQNWVNLHRTMTEEPNLPREACEPYRRNGELFKWSVLDGIAANVDRHGNNLMVGPADEGNKIGLIDHGSTFAGASFDPGNDSDTFVPYYLRVWAGADFHGLHPNEQIQQMPTLSGEKDDEFREWVLSLQEDDISALLHRYGMDPTFVTARLAEFKDLVRSHTSATEATNRFWLANHGHPESIV